MHFIVLGSLPIFAKYDDNKLIYNACNQIVDQNPVICKLAVYRATFRSVVIGQKPINGRFLVSSSQTWEAVVVDSCKGNLKPGDFVVFNTGGVEPQSTPNERSYEVDDTRQIIYVYASELKPASDGRVEIVDAQRVPTIPKLFIPIFETVLKEKNIKQISGSRVE